MAVIYIGLSIRIVRSLTVISTQKLVNEGAQLLGRFNRAQNKKHLIYMLASPMTINLNF